MLLLVFWDNLILLASPGGWSRRKNGEVLGNGEAAQINMNLTGFSLAHLHRLAMSAVESPQVTVMSKLKEKWFLLQILERNFKKWIHYDLTDMYRVVVFFFLFFLLSHLFILNRHYLVPTTWTFQSMQGIRNQFDHHAVYSIMMGGEIYNQECSLWKYGCISLMNTG